MSYLAISQWKAAALQPPSLKAICPWEGFTDAYRDLMRPGGIREGGFLRIWSRVLRRVRQRYRPLLGGWWRGLVPALEQITVPALICGSFSDNNLHSRGSFRGWEGVSSSDRFLYTHRGGKWTTSTPPRPAPRSPESLAAGTRRAALPAVRPGTHLRPPAAAGPGGGRPGRHRARPLSDPFQGGGDPATGRRGTLALAAQPVHRAVPDRLPARPERRLHPALGPDRQARLLVPVIP